MKGIITLSGSTRFKDEFLHANMWLTLGGWVVLMPGVFGHKLEGPVKEIATVQKDLLDELHKEKIQMSSAVLVIDIDGYIGESTHAEIDYAEELGIPVYYLSTPEILDNLDNS